MWSRRADAVLVAVSVSVLVGARESAAQGPELTVERRGIVSTVDSAPAFVAAGDRYTARFLVRNAGNAPAVVRLRASAAPKGSVLPDSAGLHLDVGAEKMVHAATQTNAREKARLVH